MSTSQRAVTPCGWGVKAGTVRAEWQVKLGDRLVTHRPYISALQIKGLYIKHYINSPVYFFLLCYVTAGDNIISISYIKFMFPVPVGAYTFLLASQQIQYRCICSW